MADVKISDLTDGTAIVAGDLIEIERPGSPAVSRKINIGAELAALGGVGVGQSWQDVSGSRTWATSYQNTTGKPIEVVIFYTSGSATSLQPQVSANNSSWINTGRPSNNNSYNTSFIVPDGHYYRLDNGTGTTGRAINVWSELR